MEDGRWAGWAMVDGHWGTRLLLAGLQPRRAKGGSWEGAISAAPTSKMIHLLSSSFS